MVRKFGRGKGCALFFVGRTSPSDTMSRGPRPTSVPSGILSHPVIWPQYTNVTDRQSPKTSVQFVLDWNSWRTEWKRNWLIQVRLKNDCSAMWFGMVCHLKATAYLCTKFEDPSFTHSKDMKQDPKFKNSLIWGGYGQSRLSAMLLFNTLHTTPIRFSQKLSIFVPFRGTLKSNQPTIFET